MKSLSSQNINKNRYNNLWVRMKIKLSLVLLLLTVSLSAQDIRRNNWGDSMEDVIAKEYAKRVPDSDGELTLRTVDRGRYCNIYWYFAFNKLYSVKIMFLLEEYDILYFMKGLVKEYGSTWDYTQGKYSATAIWIKGNTKIRCNICPRQQWADLFFSATDKELLSEVAEWEKAKQLLK